MTSYRIIIEKEYYSLSLNRKKPVIGCLMMVKDEEKRIHVSLDSICGIVDCLVIYDTGSTDNTIQIIQNYCEKNKINLYMIQGEFINFAVSRNVSLDYADTKNVHFYILLDVNDELRGGDNLIKFAQNQIQTDNNAFLVCQHWWSGNYDKYYNTRFIRARSNWRYKGSVHEWMCDMNNPPGKPVFRMNDDIVLYQDRTKDGDKSKKRFNRDKILLLEDHKKNPKEPRVLFYLAQTCSCLNHNEEALNYYKLRSELEGFQEEKFHSLLRCGEISEILNKNWYDSFTYYMKAFNHSERVEPVLKIAEYYNRKKKWSLAFTFANLACSLPYPENAILFVDKRAYDYNRWHILGIVAYYCQKYEEGKIACLKAIDQGIHLDLNKKNLQFYLWKEQELLKDSEKITKKEFINKTIESINKNNKIPMKKLQKIALSKWKKHQQKMLEI